MVIGRGRLLADATVAELLERSRGAVVVRVRTTAPDALAQALGARGGRRHGPPDGALHVRGASVEEVGAAAARTGGTVLELAAEAGSLEAAYLELTGGFRRVPGRWCPVTAVTSATGPSVVRVVRAEWTKLLGLRSTHVTVAATVLLVGFLTHLSASASAGDPGFVPTRGPGGRAAAGLRRGPRPRGPRGDRRVQHGTFRSTFAAVPRRVPVLLAQAVVTAAVALVTGVLSVAAAVRRHPARGRLAGHDPRPRGGGVPALLLGSVVFLVGAGLLGLAVGALLRRAVPALVTAVVLLLVAPVVLSFAAEAATTRRPCTTRRTRRRPPRP